MPNISKSDYEVKSSIGVAALVSGRQDGHFILQLLDPESCRSGEALSLHVRTSGNATPNLQWTACDGESTQYSIESSILGFDRATSQTVTVDIYIKDRFGNVSRVDSSGDQSYQLQVDITKPNLETNSSGTPVSLGLEFGIVPITEDSPPFIFGLSQIKLRQDNLQQYHFTFANSNVCRTLETDQTGPYHRIHAFRVRGQNEMSNRITDPFWNLCPTEFLRLSDIQWQWPTASNQTLEFYLQVVDRAGNFSDSLQMTIPSCVASPAADFCWE